MSTFIFDNRPNPSLHEGYQCSTNVQLFPAGVVLLYLSQVTILPLHSFQVVLQTVVSRCCGLCTVTHGASINITSSSFCPHANHIITLHCQDYASTVVLLTRSTLNMLDSVLGKQSYLGLI